MLQFREIITYIFIIGAAQGILLSIFLFKKQENKTANRLLAVTMIFFVIDLLAGVTFLTGYVYKIPDLIGINSTLPYLYGPCIFLYTILLGRKKEGFKWQYLLHYIPFVLVQIYGLFFFYFEDPAYKLSLLDFTVENPWHIELVGKLIPFHGCTYVILTIIQVFKFNRRLKDSYSNIDKLNLKWLNYLVAGAAIIWLIVVFAYVLDFIYGEELQANILIYIGISFLLYALGFKSLRQQEVILLGETIVGNKENRDEISKASSYKKSGLTDETASHHLENLMKLMEEKKPYLDDKLNLTDLSKMLNISTHNLSEIINTKLNQKFYDFVNKYRVEEVKRMILEDTHSQYNILALGYEAGFSSKSAFYTSFKKVCGITPAQYKSKLKEKAQAI